MKKFTLLFIFIASFSIHSQSIIINEIMSSNSSVLQDEDGDYSDWIELYNPSSSSINLLNFSISDDISVPRKWIFPDIDLGTNEYLIVFASDKDRFISQLHTNFKISSAGEDLILTDDAEQIIDHIEPTPITSNISLGRSNSDPSDWLFFTEATPGGPNITEGFSAISENPIFSIQGGFFTSPLSLVLSTESDTNDVYYTTDGSDPTITSNEYTAPININNTSVIRARVFAANKLPSKIITYTYFINEDYSLPVISLSTNPDNFWDDEIGIYVEGTNGIPGNCMETPANWNQDWERPIHIEFYEKDKSLAFNIDAGVQIHGGCSRKSPQKSLAIIARGEYGSKDIPYKIFPHMDYDSFQSIILRNSGQDNWYSFMRDGLMHTLVEDLDLETMAYRPSIVYINGNYWGIYNIRERTNDDYLARRHDVDEHNLDILRKSTTVVEGDYYHYEALTDYLEQNDISNDTHFSYVKTQMDIESYTNYLLSEMYFVNTDWYPGNMKFWRPKTSDGRWRWILFDTDNGFDLYSDGYVDFNMVARVSNIYREPSVIFNNIIQNQNYKNQFINKFADFANTIFEANRVNFVIDSIKSIIEPEMPRQIQKWGVPWQQAVGIDFWHEEIQRLRDFGNERLTYMYQNFINDFDLDGIAQVNLNVNDVNYGSIKLNSLHIESYPWNGDYFQNNTIRLEAIPKLGYIFVGWTGDIESSERIINYNPMASNNITAVFQIDNNKYPVVINEINYNSPDPIGDNPERSDWVELYNNSDETIDLSGWKFKDENHTFTIREGTLLTAKEYLILVEMLDHFLFYYPGVSNILTDSLDFGFSGGGEPLSLYNLNGTIVDSVEYDDSIPWPTLSDGQGPTLELNHPDLNNEVGENWSASANEGGTPGSENSVIQSKLLINVHLFLEGALNGSILMSASVSQLSGFPLNQPFNKIPWFYSGFEKLINKPNNDITDWVLVELRENIEPETIISRRAGLLRSDGNIVDLDGESSLSFYNVPSGEYYISVYHRNHLAILSSVKIQLNEID